MEDRINITGLQGNRLVLKAAIPDVVDALPDYWTLQQIADVIGLLKSGRSNKAKQAAIAALESILAYRTYQRQIIESRA